MHETHTENKVAPDHLTPTNCAGDHRVNRASDQRGGGEQVDQKQNGGEWLRKKDE